MPRLRALLWPIPAPSGFPADGKYQVTTPSGLQYTDVKVGDGATPKTGQHVTVHYAGYLTNGQKFDASKDHGSPFTFTIGEGQVIKGWDEGVMGMKIGGERLLRIPADLGYGARGAGGAIPPNATLAVRCRIAGRGSNREKAVLRSRRYPHFLIGLPC